MKPRRHSVRIAGHATSVSIEDPFWEELRRAAAAEGIGLSHLIERIDRGRMAGGAAGRTPANLSSALRLYVLERLKAEAGRESP